MTLVTDNAPSPFDWRSRYPFEHMKPGHHTVIDPALCYFPVHTIRSCISYHAKKTGKKFMTRVDKNTGLLHVWRMS